MDVISLFNEKGGVGKTSMATHLAAGLAIRGHRVLLVDSDAQGHSSIAFGLQKEPGMYDLLVNKSAWKDLLRPVPPAQYYEGDIGSSKGTLFLLPSNVQTRIIGEKIEDDVFSLHARLQEIKSLFDYVIIDTSPSPSKFQAVLFAATDGIVIPSRLEVWGFDGLMRIIQGKESFDKFRLSKGLSETKFIGIVPTMYKAKTVEHSENLDALKEAFGAKVMTPIPERVVWSEAAHFKKSLFALMPDGKAAKDAWRFCTEVVEAMSYVQA